MCVCVCNCVFGILLSFPRSELIFAESMYHYYYSPFPRIHSISICAAVQTDETDTLIIYPFPFTGPPGAFKLKCCSVLSFVCLSVHFNWMRMTSGLNSKRTGRRIKREKNFIYFGGWLCNALLKLVHLIFELNELRL